MFDANFQPDTQRPRTDKPKRKPQGEYDQWGVWVNPVGGTSEHGNVYREGTTLDSWGNPIGERLPEWL